MEIREKIKKAKKIVVKVGTSTITYPNGRLNLRHIEELAWVLSDLKNQQKDVVLVSSGSIGVGSMRLSFDHRPTQVRQKQAAAAVGQAVLVQIYQNFFNTYQQTVAQILLTKEVLNEKESRENAVNTFETLMEMGVIPIVNANDTVSTDEVVQDNDRLSAFVAELIGADLLILLTDIDGLYDCDPKTNKEAKRIPYVPLVTQEIEKMAGCKGSEFSVGGMETKLQAAKICQASNVSMVIASGENPAILHKILAGEDVGTCFGS